MVVLPNDKRKCELQDQQQEHTETSSQLETAGKPFLPSTVLLLNNKDENKDQQQWPINFASPAHNRNHVPPATCLLCISLTTPPLLSNYNWWPTPNRLKMLLSYYEVYSERQHIRQELT